MRLQASLILILLAGPTAWAQSVRDFPPPRKVSAAPAVINSDADQWYPTGGAMPRPIPKNQTTASPYVGAIVTEAPRSAEPTDWWGDQKAVSSSSIQQVTHQQLVPGIPAEPLLQAPGQSGTPVQAPEPNFGNFSFPAPQRQQLIAVPPPEAQPSIPNQHLTPPPAWNQTGNMMSPSIGERQAAPVMQIDTAAPVYAPPSFPSPFPGNATQTAMYSDPALAPPPLHFGELHCDSMGCDYAPGNSNQLFGCNDCGWLMPFLDLQVYGGNHRTIGKGDVFVPLWQTNEHLVFFDMRVEFDDRDAVEANWGIGYRRLFDSSWILGLYGYYDLLHSSHGNNFGQGTLGVEFLTLNWDFRLNGYIPTDGQGYAPATFAISNGNVVTRDFVEKSYGGFDFETGYRVGHWGENDNVELRWFLGGFVYDASGPNYDTMVGPKTRVEMRLYDLDFLGQQARVEGGAEFTWDEVRNEQVFGFVRVRIPLGRPIGGRLGPLQRRMVDQPSRNID